MNLRKVVVHEVECHTVRVVLDFLAESISKARESPIPHSHAEILAFDVAGRNVGLVWTPHDGLALDSDAFRRAVTRFLLARCVQF